MSCCVAWRGVRDATQARHLGGGCLFARNHDREWPYIVMGCLRGRSLGGAAKPPTTQDLGSVAHQLRPMVRAIHEADWRATGGPLANRSAHRRASAFLSRFRLLAAQPFSGHQVAHFVAVLGLGEGYSASSQVRC